MPDVLHSIKIRIRKILSDDSLDWFDSSYVIDWIVVLGLFILGHFVRVVLPVFERDFSPDDPLIQHPHTSEQVSSSTNTVIAVGVPVTLAIFVGGYRNSAHEIHHGLLATLSGSTLNRLVTDTMKNLVGRLRPDFVSRCQWDASQRICTGDAQQIIEGRLSFPSGHSSTAFAAMSFVSLFLAGKTAALCFGVTPPCGPFFRSRMVRLCLVFLPLAFAAWVAITRIEDYRHHKEDVIVGSVIGIISGTTCYLLYWPNPFSAQSFSTETMGRPRLDLANGIAVGSRGSEGYRLAPESPDFETV